MNINIIAKSMYVQKFFSIPKKAGRSFKVGLSFLNKNIFFREINSRILKLPSNYQQQSVSKRSICVLHHKTLLPILFTFRVAVFQIIIAKKKKTIVDNQQHLSALSSNRISKAVVKDSHLEFVPDSAKSLDTSVSESPISFREMAINIIVSDIQDPSSWNNLAGEIAVYAITKLPSWPKTRELQIKAWSQTLKYNESKGSYLNPVELVLKNCHYQPIIDGREEKIAADGNCFYHSILLSLTTAEKKKLLGDFFIHYQRKNSQDDTNNPNVDTLRQLLACHIKRNPNVIDDFLAVNGFNYQDIVEEREKQNRKEKRIG